LVYPTAIFSREPMVYRCPKCGNTEDTITETSCGEGNCICWIQGALCFGYGIIYSCIMNVCKREYDDITHKCSKCS
jgi:hypothetical protein